MAALQKAGFKGGVSRSNLISVTGPEQGQQFKALATIFH